MDLKEQILVALGLNKAEETIKLEWQAKSEDGTIFVSTAEELESGVDISVLTEDGTTIPLPIGTYKTAEGVSFRVEEEGVVSEVIESETEEKEEASEEVKEEMGEDRGEDDDEAAVDDWEGMEKRIKNLEDAVSDLKRQIGEKGDVEEMAEEVTEPRSTSPKTITTKEVVEFSAEEIEAIKAENEKLKTELAESPADKPINTNKFSSERVVLSRKEYNKLSKQEKFLYNLNK
jgi:regulator of replication initiation timing